MAHGYTTKVRPEKVEAVDRIKNQLGETQAVVLTEYRGLSVGELADLRTKLQDNETSYRVVKNTLARRAVADAGLGELEELFVGPVAVAYVKGDPVSAARVLATFAREHPALVIKGGVLEGRVLSAEETRELATVDTLDVSRAKIAGLLIAPLRQLMFVLEAPTARIIYVLEQLGAEAPAEEPADQQTEGKQTETEEEGSSDGEG
jgi:large subunit ribosomal protein L10